MRKLTYIAFCIASLTAFAFADAPEITPTLPDTDEDGCYLIESADHLYGFAALVNGKLEDTERNKSACGILVNNITVNDDVLDEDGTLKADEEDLAPWTPIMSFSGKFDGNGKTISGLYFKGGAKDTVGLFGSVGKGGNPAIIKNVGLVDSYFETEHISGGIVGVMRSEAKADIFNSYNEGTVIGDTAGGILGTSKNNEEIIRIYNSYNIGYVTGNKTAAGIVGAAGGKVSVTNTYNLGDVDGDHVISAIIAHAKSNAKVSILNTFFLDSFDAEDDDTTPKGATKASQKEFENGTVLLSLKYYSDKEIDGSVWGQNVKKGSHPDLSEKVKGITISDLTLVIAKGDTTKSKYIEGIKKELPTPSREGYSFLGWYDNEDFDNDTITAITKKNTGDLTFYAKWQEIRCKLSLSVNDTAMGSVSGAGKYSCGKEVTIEATANEGYSFTEWNDGNTKASRSVKVKTDTSFKATFKANTYKVTLHKGEGKLESELSSYTYGKGATLPNATRTNYTFDGWFDNSEFEGKAVTKISKTDKGDKEFWAKWTKAATSSSSSKPSSSSSGKSSSSKGKSSSSSKKVSSSSVSSSSSSETYNFSLKKITPKEPKKEKDCYQIGTVEELFGFAAIVNGTDSMTRDSAACGKLTDDIVVNEDLLKDNGRFDGQKTEIIPWTPMKEFAGQFDGNRKKISGLFFKDSADAIGLFGSITGGSEKEPVVIKDLGLVDSYIEGYTSVGGIVGTATTAHLSLLNVYNTSTIVGYNNIGGLLGSGIVDPKEDTLSKYTLTIANCYNTGLVEATFTAGGLVGIAGEVVTLVNSYNFGKVSGSEHTDALIGFNFIGINISIWNTYYSSEQSSRYGGISAEEENFKNGSILKRLQEWTKEADGSVWGQAEGNDLPALTYEKKKAPSSKEDAIAKAKPFQQFSVQAFGRTITLSGALTGTKIIVTDLQGRLVAKAMATGNELTINIPHSGAYIVRIGSQVNRVTIK